MKLAELFEEHHILVPDLDENGLRVWDKKDEKTGKWLIRSVKFSDKDEFLKQILIALKNGHNIHSVHNWMTACRKAGYGYHEFKTLEDSMFEGTKEDGIPMYDGHGTPTRVIKFKDKEAFIRLCLKELKSGSLGDVHQWIHMAKKCGYDYPEFKTILASIEADFKERK